MLVLRFLNQYFTNQNDSGTMNRWIRSQITDYSRTTYKIENENRHDILFCFEGIFDFAHSSRNWIPTYIKRVLDQDSPASVLAACTALRMCIQNEDFDFDFTAMFRPQIDNEVANGICRYGVIIGPGYVLLNYIYFGGTECNVHFFFFCE